MVQMAQFNQVVSKLDIRIQNLEQSDISTRFESLQLEISQKTLDMQQNQEDQINQLIDEMKTLQENLENLQLQSKQEIDKLVEEVCVKQDKLVDDVQKIRTQDLNDLYQ